MSDYVDPFRLLLDQLDRIETLQRELLSRPVQIAEQEELPITIKTAADVLAISPYTLRRHAEKNKIPHRYMFGKYYFFRSELIAYLKGDSGEWVQEKKQNPGRGRRKVRTLE